MRSQLIHILYRGGQLAIAAELAVILGIAIAILSRGGPMVSSTDLSAVLHNAEDLARQMPLAYVLIFTLILLLPSLLMLWVVWAWHLYFQFTGMLVFHWVMTSIALMGLGTILVAYSIVVLGMGVYIQGMDQGYLETASAYPVLAILAALQSLGVFLAYWLYPGLVGIVLLSQGKLSYAPMVLVAILFLFFNPFLIALSPFILGVMLLLQARRLANLPPLLQGFETDK
jgi:hypothetical protein